MYIYIYIYNVPTDKIIFFVLPFIKITTYIIRTFIKRPRIYEIVDLNS